MKRTPVVLLALCCALLTGCQAARPLTDPSTKPGRQLLSVNWGSFSCAGLNNIGFSTSYKALDVPTAGVIMGQVRIHNRGDEPFQFNTPGFRLMGLGGYMDSMMKCPGNEVPAGGALQCGFVAPSIETLAFDSFRPFFIRDASATPCFCQQPYSIDPFTTQPQSDSLFDDLEEAVNAHEHVAKDFANAVADAFEVTGKTLSNILHQAADWHGDALGLAENIADSLFSIRINIGDQVDEPAVSQPQPAPQAATLPPQAQAPTGTVSTGTDAKADAGAATGAAQQPAERPASTPSNQDSATAPKRDAPVVTEPAAPKVPAADAPADAKTDSAIAPSKPAVDAARPSDSAPVSKPTNDVTAPKPATDSKDVKPTPAVTAPTEMPLAAASQPSTATPAPKSDDKAVATPQPTPTAAPTDAPKATQPAAATPTPAPETKQATTPSEKPTPATTPADVVKSSGPAAAPTVPVAADTPKTPTETPVASTPAAKPTPSSEQTKAPTAATAPGSSDKAAPVTNTIPPQVPATQPVTAPKADPKPSKEADKPAESDSAVKQAYRVSADTEPAAAAVQAAPVLRGGRPAVAAIRA